MKSQIPTFNIQRKSKNQTPRSVNGLVNGVYPEPVPLSAALNDGPNERSHVFDLEERTALFGEAIVRFSKKIPRDPTNNRLLGQLVGCSTSIGANYREANENVSKKDFRLSISRCVKEAKETKFFLRMVAASEAPLVPEARKHFREVQELHMIFASIFRKVSK